MTNKKVIETAVAAMEQILRMVRKPMVTRRGRVIIQDFVKAAKEKEKKTEE